VKALLISPEAPYPAIGGGALRTASLIEFLARRYELDVIVFGQPENSDPARSFPQGLVRRVLTIPLRHHRRNLLAKLLRNAARLMRDIPPLVDRFQGYEPEVLKAIEGQQYEIAVFEHLWSAPLLPTIQPFAKRTYLDLHNIESALFDTYAESDRWPISMAHSRWANASRLLEAKLLPQFNALLTCSNSDAENIRQYCSNIHVFPNSIPSTPLPEMVKQADLVFSGNLEYPPNKTAVVWFHREVWPQLSATNPSVTWRIVGLHPEAVRGVVGADPRIIVTGSVEKAVPAIAASHIAIVPLLSGSGTRIKILEAWAAGLPVVSTTLGAQGLDCIPEKEILIADTPANFAATLRNLLDNKELCLRLGSAGRYLYEREYTWEAAWKKLEVDNPFGANRG
jgi:polysaccharide biosynthesis protein PslH